MGRPRASSAVREFAALFANVVTAHSSYRYDWVARTGRHSIFVLLSQLAPKVRIAMPSNLLAALAFSDDE